MKRVVLDAREGARDVLEIVCDAAGGPRGVVWRARGDGAVTFEAAGEIAITGPLLEGLFREDGGAGAGLLVAHAATRAGATLRSPARLAIDPLAFEALGVPGAIDAALLAAGARVWIAPAGDARALSDIPQKDRVYLDDPIALRPGDRAFVDVTRVPAGDPARRCLTRHLDWAGRDVTHVPVFPWIRDAGDGFAPLTRAEPDDDRREGDRRAAALATALDARLAEARGHDGENVHLLFAEVSALLRRALLSQEAGEALADLETLARRARDARAPDGRAFMNRSILALLELDAALALGRVLLEAAVPPPGAVQEAGAATYSRSEYREASTLDTLGASPPGPTRKLQLDVTRRDAPGAPPRREVFEVTVHPKTTVHDALLAVRARPVDRSGRVVAPIVWDAPCARETCGACTLLVDGQARLACTTLLEDVSPKGKAVHLAPLSKSPCLRDLVVARGTSPRLSLPVLTPAAPDDGERDALARCIDCGACYEACPETAAGRAFVGPAELAAARRAQLGAPAEAHAAIFEALMRDGGVAACGKAQNCVEVCPVDVPVYDAIAHLLRETTRHALRRRS